LKTYWLFSFGDHQDPDNVDFGNLRVFNHDLIGAGGEFPTHPHREMEIVTLVLEGEITHADSMGNTREVIRSNEVQRMSSGTGVRHSEANASDEQLVLFQVWFYPSERDLEPSYDRMSFDPAAWKNRLHVLVGDGDDTVSIHSDCRIMRCDLDDQRRLNYSTAKNRGTFIYLFEGSLVVNGVSVSTLDQVRATEDDSLEISAQEDSRFVLIDVAA